MIIKINWSNGQLVDLQGGSKIVDHSLFSHYNDFCDERNKNVILNCNWRLGLRKENKNNQKGI